ncbi:MAG: hypothetical protein HN368_10695 [Spirochaetales bacterium]|jgi:hypothetical protein|nr:hypothetical protein [Spirochaetales bacterium]
MKKTLFIILMVALTFPAMAQNATVQRVSGKVEIMRPGESWTSVSTGSSFPVGATISTGFRSSAVLLVAGSEITVLALTRMSVDDLVETPDTVTTSLNLRTGKVRAQVRSTEGKSINFRLRSPVSTAAVRGTEFVFDGFRLEVIEGAVQFFNKLNESRFVLAGNWSQTTGGSGPTDPQDNQQADLSVSTDTSGDSDGGDGADDVPPVMGQLIINVQPDASEGQ